MGKNDSLILSRLWTKVHEVSRRRTGLPVVSDVLAQWHMDPCGQTVSYTHLRAHETVLDLVCRF